MSNPSSIELSVIIPTYNYARFIEEAIQSIIKQVSLDKVEIIVVDDGSTDDTRSRLQPYIQKKILRYFYKENGGQASAINLGYRESHGEVITVLDADDYWLPEFYSKMLSHHKNTDCGAVFGNLELFWDDHSKENKLYRNLDLHGSFPQVSPSAFRVSAESYDRFFSPMSGQTFKRHLCELLFPIPQAFIRHADTYLHHLTLVYTDLIFEAQGVVAYRQHTNSHIANLGRKEMRFVALEIELNERINQEIALRDVPKKAKKFLRHRRNYCDQLKIDFYKTKKKYLSGLFLILSCQNRPEKGWALLKWRVRKILHYFGFRKTITR